MPVSAIARATVMNTALFRPSETQPHPYPARLRF
jgi:hypothetical protein